MLFSWEHQKYQNIHPGAHFGTSLGGSWGGRRVPPCSCLTILKNMGTTVKSLVKFYCICMLLIDYRLIDSLLIWVVDTQAMFLYCCSKCPSSPAHLNLKLPSTGWATWAIWATANTITISRCTFVHLTSCSVVIFEEKISYTDMMKPLSSLMLNSCTSTLQYLKQSDTSAQKYLEKKPQPNAKLNHYYTCHTPKAAPLAPLPQEI